MKTFPIDKAAAQSIIQSFLEDKNLQQSMAKNIDLLTTLCAAAAAAKGFHDEEHQARAALPTKELRAWFDTQLLQAEIGRIMSEGGEMIEGVRKPVPDSHCPSFDNWVVEGADIIIRLADTFGKRDTMLGQAVISKLIYNLSRPYKHNKNS